MELVQNRNKIEEYRKRAEDLVAQMTLSEKVAQTMHQTPAIKRLGIKAYNWWNEALHGVARAGTATIFPQAIGMAATFDEDLMEQIGDAVSTEARAKFAMQQEGDDEDIYKGLTFWAPNVNIFRDPRWGRGHETFGEDPYLTSRLGVRYIMGLQGHDENYLKTAACAKHFAVHSGPEDQRHSFDARVNEQDLRETYLPAFQACVQEAKVETVMGAYNRTNGEPCCGSRRLLSDILRNEWGFDGHVVSDCWAIKDFHEHHGVTANPIESVSLAMNNGCDLNCGSLFLYLEQAVQEGLVDERRLDEAVVNLFTSRMKLGVFDQKGDNPYENIPYTVVDSPNMRKLNQQVAERCVVLLKNDKQILPLKKEKIRTIGVIGPNADNRRALVGNYEGTASRYVTILEGIQDYVGDDVRVLYSEGCHLYKDRTSGLAQENDRASEVRGICRESDVIVAVMGLDASLEGEEGDTGNEYGSGDKPNLRLPGLQHNILKLAKESGKPVILVLLTGSAMAVTWEDENLDAILQGWYPGAQGGAAIARILFGEVNPEGKLPVTFYRTTEELPDFEDYSMQNRTYRYMENKPLYPFGYGLSYTQYEYSDIAFTEEKPDINAGVTVQFTVTNTGERDGMETVQVYVKVKMVGTPNAQLKGIKKVYLKAGESRQCQIYLPREAFMLYDKNGNNKIAGREYEISIGGSQPDTRSEELTGHKTEHLRCFYHEALKTEE
ncbi:MAG: glycoside hydrolase family 3 C-terminal domain-containing protein [Lachnospiraceae bacterium]|nr:glycoside hydrolase family 3 C-terminal domain-containing protein [Lachnospiraceae bacterium]